jgi:putative peptidoglycan lipid II flippase
VAFSRLFEQINWMPHGGLALSVSVSTGLEVTTLLVVMRKRLQGLPEREIGRAFNAAALGTVGMVTALVAWQQALASAPAALTTLGGVALGAAIYSLTLILLRVPEVGAFLAAIKRRLPL